MAITAFAAIDIGSSEISLKIFEVSKKIGIRELDYVRHPIELGSETYTNGKISHKLVNELCEVLIGFTQKMKEYQVNDYTALATSAVREASNNMLILDQIKLSAGLKVKIISNSEQRFLCYKALALKEAAFNSTIKEGTAIVDVGGGSIQLSLFNKEALVSTQNIKLGSLRIRELLLKMENRTSNFQNLISEYIDNDIFTFKTIFLSNMKVKNMIAVGDQINDFLRYVNEKKGQDTIDKKTFHKLYTSLSSKSTDEISRTLDISRDQASLLLPTAMIYEKLFRETNIESMWVSNITLCDGIVAEYAEKKEKIIPSHNFTADIVTAARNIAKRYECNTDHSKNIEYLSLGVFDSIRKFHGLGKRERLLLQIAVILHNCGEYINMSAVAENSYHIIMSTEIIGLSHLERSMVANLVRYNTGTFPKYREMEEPFDKESYIKINKLNAILRIANAMDRSHKQKFSNVTFVLKDKELIITAETLKDITLEWGLFDKKADFFEEVYGIRPVLKQKRTI